ncbi:MAG: ADYC domain-containing protein [Nannocystaceae bacterium]
MTRHSAAAALLAALLLPACDSAPDPELRSFAVSDEECPRWRCGYNTSEINGKSLQELNLDGAANSDGVALVGFLPPLGLLLNYELHTEGDALLARGGLLGKSELRGPALVGGALLLKVDGLVVPVLIAGYEEVTSWAEGGAPVPAYALVYADLAEPLLQRSVCKGTLVDPLQASVVILAGDRYDLDAKTVSAGNDGWFTLACAGSAAAKMALLGYGPNAEVEGEPAPSADQRQATLKMITADYCGTGHSYTEDGTPLRWENGAGTVLAGDADPSDLEAIWTADGAACLDTPRIVDPDDVACELPSCASATLGDGEWATYVVAE